MSITLNCHSICLGGFTFGILLEGAKYGDTIYIFMYDFAIGICMAKCIFIQNSVNKFVVHVVWTGMQCRHNVGLCVPKNGI